MTSSFRTVVICQQSMVEVRRDVFIWSKSPTYSGQCLQFSGWSDHGRGPHSDHSSVVFVAPRKFWDLVAFITALVCSQTATLGGFVQSFPVLHRRSSLTDWDSRWDRRHLRVFCVLYALHSAFLIGLTHIHVLYTWLLVPRPLHVRVWVWYGLFQANEASDALPNFRVELLNGVVACISQVGYVCCFWQHVPSNNLNSVLRFQPTRLHSFQQVVQFDRTDGWSVRSHVNSQILVPVLRSQIWDLQAGYSDYGLCGSKNK